MPDANPYLSTAQDHVASAFEFCSTRALSGSVDNTFPASSEGRELLKAAATVPMSTVREFSRKAKDRWGNEFNKTHFFSDVAEARRNLGVAAESKYLMTSSGAIRPVVANAITMLADLPIRYNLLSCRPELTSDPPWGARAGKWEDLDDSRAAEWCQRNNLHITTNIAAEAVQVVASSRSYHPVRDYLNAIQHDGKPRLRNWLTEYGDAAEDELTCDVGVRWMVSGVARIMRPGCQADYMLVLEGKEGIRKSSALRTLGDPWFTDDISDIGHGHEAAINLQGYWIVEIKELASFKRAEWQQVLGWLDRRQDKFRPPYGRRSQEFARQNIFSGSTNQQQWITGEHGTRRFWPVWLNKIDLEGLERDRDQLWAEAYQFYKNGIRWYLDEDLNSSAAQAQRQRKVSDPWTRMITEWCRYPAPRAAGAIVCSSSETIYISEVLENCIGLPPAQWRQGEGSRVEVILRGLGYLRAEEGVYAKE